MRTVQETPDCLVPKPNTPEQEAKYVAEDNARRQASVLRMREWHEMMIKAGVKPEAYYVGKEVDGKIVYKQVKYFDHL